VTTILKATVFALAGLAVGWAAASKGRGDRQVEEGMPDPVRPAAVSKSRPRPSTGAPALADVAACRAVLFSAAPDDQHPLLRQFEREQALRRWLELDAPGALVEAAKEPEEEFAKDLFEAWVELDPRAALDALNASSRDLTVAVALNFFVALMNRDPAMAADELARPKWKDGNEDLLGWSFHKEVQRQWMRADPAAAIASFGPPGSKSSLSEAERAMAEIWAESDFPAAWAHFAAKGLGDDVFALSQAMSLLAKGLLKGDPQALEIESMLERPDDPFVSHPRGQIAEALVESNSRAALAWASSRPEDDPLRLAIEARAARALASSDPEAALAMLQASGGSDQSWEDEGILRESFAALAAADPVGAAARVIELPEKHRVQAMGGVLTRVFAGDPAAAEAQCRAWLDDPALQPAAAKAWALSFSWSHGSGPRDPGPMLDAIPELNDAVDAYVLSTWTKVDPEAAAGWIQERLDLGKKVALKGEYGDKGIFADLAISRPEFTATWLAGLPDPTVQAAAANVLAANWWAFDPAAADAWIESLPTGPVREAAEKGRSGWTLFDRSDPFAGH
jgi:hypothetical protein